MTFKSSSSRQFDKDWFDDQDAESDLWQQDLFVLRQRCHEMIFSARQTQEKCQEQRRDLNMVFINLTKSFDSVNRQGLWLILHKIGCTDKFIIIRSFHEGMKGQVIETWVLSDLFGMSNGTKQGCVLAPLFFCIFFAMMLLGSLQELRPGYTNSVSS